MAAEQGLESAKKNLFILTKTFIHNKPEIQQKLNPKNPQSD
jgi:hypothetical protein